MPLRSIRVWSLFFPPIGLLLLWKSRSVRIRTKLLGTAGILFYLIPYVALIVVSLIKFAGLKIEWRGGYLPSFTFAKAVPDYAKLEAHRLAQKTMASSNSLFRAATNASWPGFRGPRRDGQSTELSIRTNWLSGTPGLLWRQPCGGGYASFAIADGVAFTLEQRREYEVVAAYELETGREVWTNGWPGAFQESMGGDGPRATPTFDQGRLYVLGAEGQFRCLEAGTGQSLWARNILQDNGAPNLTYGMAGSPLVLSNSVVVQPGGKSNRSVVAYDKTSGEVRWGALSDGASYSSPMLVRLADVDQILVVTASRAAGLSPETGAKLWDYPWVVLHGNVNIAQPVILGSNSFFLSAGYGTGCAAVEVRQEAGVFGVKTLWQNRLLKNKFTSSVLWQGHLYGLDEDILTCLDVETGTRKWKEGRYGYGQLILAAGQLIIATGSGEIAVVAARPDKHDQVLRFPAIEGKTWNHPALTGGRLLVRNGVEMACFDFLGP